MDLGGAQDHLLRLVEGLDPDRFEVLAAVGSAGGDRGELLEELNSVAEVIELRHLRREVTGTGDVRSIDEIRQLLRRIKPDVLHTHSSKAGVVGRLAAGRALRVVHNVHGWSFSPLAPGLRRAAVISLERRLARKTDVLLFVAEADRCDATRLRIVPRAGCELIRSGIDLDRFSGGQGIRVASRQEPPVVGTVGRLSPQKDPIAAMQMLSRLNAVIPGVRLRWVGDGPLRAATEAEARRLGLAGQVELLGSRRDVPEQLGQFDAFFLTSRWEGLPRSLVEAAAAGVPAAAFDVGGVRELLEDGVSGRLVPPGDVDGIASAVSTLLSNRKLAHEMAQAASDRSRKFSSREMCQRTASVYEALLR